MRALTSVLMPLPVPLQEFPLVQQGYALFLEACNSHAFNQALARCMAAKLQVRNAGFGWWLVLESMRTLQAPVLSAHRRRCPLPGRVPLFLPLCI